MRKLMILMAAVAALGVMAISASAASAVTFKEGTTVVPVSSKVTGTSTNTQTVTSVGTLKCTKVALNSSVKTNPGSPAVLNSGTGTATGCTAGAATVNIKTVTFEPIEFLANHTNKSSKIKFTYEIVGVATGCFLEGPATSTWTSGSSSIHVAASLTGGGGGLCPTSGTLSGDFSLETTASPFTAVTVND
jgi:hypothetical protein